MKILLFLVLIYSQLGLSKTAVDCQNIQNDCEYYLCMAMERNCGKKSYYISFGYKYCLKFLKAHKRNFTVAGHEWINKTRSCLIDKIDEIAPDVPCKKVKNIAFKQHVSCYVDSGYCELKNKDKRKIWRIAKRQLYRYKTIKTGIKILRRCRRRK